MKFFFNDKEITLEELKEINGNLVSKNYTEEMLAIDDIVGDEIHFCVVELDGMYC